MAENEKKAAEVETKNAKKAKPEKAKSEKKGRVKNAWNGFKSEVKKVVWPNRKKVLEGTGVVLLVVGVCVIVLAGMDFALNRGMDEFLSEMIKVFSK